MTIDALRQDLRHPVRSNTAPPEGPFENVDYYQQVMSDYFETMGIPISRGAGSRRPTRPHPAWWPWSTKRS